MEARSLLELDDDDDDNDVGHRKKADAKPKPGELESVHVSLVTLETHASKDTRRNEPKLHDEASKTPIAVSA